MERDSQGLLVELVFILGLDQKCQLFCPSSGISFSRTNIKLIVYTNKQNFVKLMKNYQKNTLTCQSRQVGQPFTWGKTGPASSHIQTQDENQQGIKANTRSRRSNFPFRKRSLPSRTVATIPCLRMSGNSRRAHMLRAEDYTRGTSCVLRV